MKVALVTSNEYPELTTDDRSALPWLSECGIEGVPMLWDAPRDRWSRFDLIVIRSTWDYQDRAAEFSDWIEWLQSEKLPVMNPATVLRWNMNKVYLRQLEKRGFPIVPTAWFEPTETFDHAEVLRSKGWARAVLKPTISASARRTISASQANLAEANAQAREILKSNTLMVQEFMTEIQTEGEWSLLFFNKQFSHAAIKRPASGDFRVQARYGGTTEPATASPGLIRTGQDLLNTVSEPLLYARVDGIVRNGVFYLMELEALEPSLLLNCDPDAPKRFAYAIHKILSK